MLYLNKQEKDEKLIKAADKTEKYLLENIVLGKIGPGEKIPLEKYMEELRLKCGRSELFKQLSTSMLINGDCVANRNITDFCQAYFKAQMNKLFRESCILKYKSFKTGELSSDIENESEFYQKVFAVFWDVLNVACGSNTIYPLQGSGLERMRKFVAAMKLMHLHPGKKVSCWLARMRDMPIYTRQMVNLQYGVYILENNDTDSIEYKLSVLSAFEFCTHENARIMAEKLNTMYEQYEGPKII